jgi:hypothetical protein
MLVSLVNWLNIGGKDTTAGKVRQETRENSACLAASHGPDDSKRLLAIYNRVRQPYV